MRYLIAGALASVMLSTAGCNMPSPTNDLSETTTSEGRTSEGPAGTAAAFDGNVLMRFVNADPNAAGMDIWVEDEPVFNHVAYMATTPYMESPKDFGELQFQLRETGTTELLGTKRQALFFGRHYTLIALPLKDDSSRLALMTDNLSLLEPGRVRVRLINASPDVLSLDLYIAGTETIVQRGVDASTVTTFTDMDPGTLEIRPVNRPAPPQFSNLEVEADHLYTFVVVGTSAALDLVQIEDRIE